MANWAIVVGVDKYWHPKFELKACVKDAVKMAQWLLTSKSCKVLPQNLYLLTRPTPPPPELGPLPSAVTRFDATFSSLVDATKRLVDRSGGKGDKFFFYFSGHGLTNDSSIDAEDAIVMADFDPTNTDNALEIRSLIEYFKSTRLNEQFFIIDACRNVLDWGTKFRTRAFTLVGEIDPKLPPVQQFTLLATSPRISAVAIGDKSAFTEELLKGLKGKGTSIALETKSGEYVVSTSRLFKFVETQIAARKINVSDDPDNPIFQKPRINGEHGSEDPELTRLTAAEVEKANLQVFVKPDPAWSQTLVTIVDQFGEEKGRINPINYSPEKLALPPMIYTARAAAPGYKAEQEKWSFDLYEDVNLPVNLIPISDEGQRVSAEELSGDINIAGADGDMIIAGRDIFTADGDMIIAGRDIFTKGFGKGSGKGRGGRRRKLAQKTKLTVRASDSLARLELADSQGSVLLTGQGAISKSELQPGFYRARLLTPEGQVVEQLVELSPGQEEEVTIGPPQPQQSSLLKEIVNTAEFTVLEDNALDVAETVGPMASAQLSTILALTGSVLNQNEKWGHRLRSLGLRSFQESVAPGTKSGLQIFSAVESDGSHRASAGLSGTKLRLWPMDQSEPESSSGLIGQSKVTGLYEFAQAAEPGQYSLSIEQPDQPSVVFALAILPARLTMLVFHRDAGGQLRVFQYSLSLSQEGRKLDPKQVRRLELAQRFYLSGRLDYALETARDLLYAKWVDPLAGCLGCYLLLRLGKADELSVAANNMVNNYDQLCDSHVLKAEYELSAGNTAAARQSFKRALDVGVPIFADGLTRLSDAVQRYSLQDHPRASVLAKMVTKRVRGFLWTAWTPSKEVRPAGINTVTNVAGDSVGGDKQTAGRDINNAEGDINIANRDVIKVAGNLYQTHQPAEQSSSLPGIFSQLLELSRSSLDADVEMVETVIDKLKESVTRIQQGDEGLDASRILASRLKSLVNVQRDVGELALERLSDPEAQVSSRIRQVAREVQAATTKRRSPISIAR